jgi:hypothetical protein
MLLIFLELGWHTDLVMLRGPCGRFGMPSLAWLGVMQRLRTLHLDCDDICTLEIHTACFPPSASRCQ